MDSGALTLVIVLVILAAVWLRRPFLAGYRGRTGGTISESRSPSTEFQLMQSMTDSQRLLFQAQMAQYRKSVGVAALLAVFGFLGMHRFYLGQIGLGVLMILTFGGLLAWALIDLCRIRTIVKEVNDHKAQEVAMRVKMLEERR